jgi:hypothetical protein
MFSTKIFSLTLPVPLLALAAAALVGYLTFSSMNDSLRKQEEEIAQLTASRMYALAAAEECSNGVTLLQAKQEELRSKLAEVEAQAKKSSRRDQDNAAVIGNAKPEFGTSSDIDDYKSSVDLINTALRRIQELKK